MLAYTLRSILTAGALALALAGCGGGGGADAVCGDGVCADSETAFDCTADCGCGNGTVDPGEMCDGDALGGATCASEMQGTGTLACNSDCTLDFSGCNQASCGNGTIDEGEACDGEALGDATCESAGFSTGTIACNDSCNLDVSGCCNDFCSTDGARACNGDTLEVCTLQDNGCLQPEITDCAANDDICDDEGGEPMCICVDRCPGEGSGQCDGALAQSCALQADGCLAWETVTDCSMTMDACAVGPDGATCVVNATGEDCSDPYPLAPGQNIIGWSAMNADYLTAQPSCGSSFDDLTGPDVVLSFTASVDGIVSYSMQQPDGSRQVIVASSAACGTVTPEDSCASEDSGSVLEDTFSVTANTTYHFYVRDTDDQSEPLSDPLLLDLSETACSNFTNDATNLSPANGTTLATASPVLSFDLEHPIDPSIGTIEIQGTGGTNLSFDLSTDPDQVTITNGGRSIEIDPDTRFVPGEELTVSWSGLQDAICGATFDPPTWSFDIMTPTCSPGTDGMVGSTTTRISATVGSSSGYFVAADTDPNGYIYEGDTNELYRTPKAGGQTEDVEAAAGIGFSELGYAMAIVGDEIFTVDSTTSTSSPFLYRLSINGGLTWNPLGFGRFPTSPEDDPKAIFHDAGTGRFYVVSDEGTSGTDTEIWSVSDSGVLLPQDAVLEGTVAGEEDCTGIAGDDTYFYLACGNDDRLVRVDRATFQPELITDAINLSGINNTLHAHDFDGDGSADALYVMSFADVVHYVCSPGAAGPFWVDALADLSSGATTYGLGFDRVNNELWVFDDGTDEFVSIK